MTRYFKSDDGRDSWHWDGNKMHLDGNGHVDSIFASPDELLAEVNVIETDEFGNELTFESTLTKQDHADIRGEHDFQARKDMEP